MGSFHYDRDYSILRVPRNINWSTKSLWAIEAPLMSILIMIFCINQRHHFTDDFRNTWRIYNWIGFSIRKCRAFRRILLPWERKLLHDTSCWILCLLRHHVVWSGQVFRHWSNLRQVSNSFYFYIFIKQLRVWYSIIYVSKWLTHCSYRNI